jgi:membrane protease YdiL (CAAX protease family)
MAKPKESMFHRHSLGIAAVAILISWIILYRFSGPGNHLGSFFGNAIADWTGVVVMVFVTKRLYEKGSSESRRPPRNSSKRLWQKVQNHSLTIFLVVTAIAWIVLYASVDSESKWGQVVGNIVSEWLQLFGLVILTKKCIETGSQESER